MKKTCSMLLVFLLLLQLPSVMAFDDVTQETPYYNEISMLNSIGIFEGDPAGSFMPDSEVTRADFAVIVARMLGVYQEGNLPSAYTDLSSDHYAAASVAVLTHMGLMSGTGNGLFEPESSVSYDQAVKVLVIALGYQQPATQLGGYPWGYIAKAGEIGVTKGLANRGILKRGELAFLVYNAMKTDIMQQTSYSDGSVEYGVKRGETLLSNIQGIYLLKNVKITDNYTTAKGTGRQLRENEVAVNGEPYDAGTTGAASFINQTVNIYYQENYGDNTRVIVHIYTNTAKNAEVTIQSREVDSFSNNVLKYTQDGRLYRVTLSSGADILYNGKTAVYSPGLFLFTDKNGNRMDGSIRLVSSSGDNSYDSVFIEAYTNIFVGSIDYMNRIIYDQYGITQALDFGKDTEAVCEVKLPGDSEIYEFEDISTEMLVSAYISEDRKYAKVYLNEGSVTGTVDGYTEDEISIDGKWYPVANPLLPSLEDKSLKLGETGVFYLDVQGKVAVLDNDETSDNYGFLMLADTSGGVDSTLQVKLLTAQNEIKVFSLAQNIRLNGSSISTTSEAGRNTFLQTLKNNPVSNGENKDHSPQIILYKLSADGLINSVETAKDGDNGSLLVGYTTGPGGKVQYKSGTKTFRMKVSADSSTVVFRVPADMTAADDEDFDAPGVSAFKHDNNYTIAAYNVNDGGVAKAIVVWDSVSKSMPSDTSAFAIVDKVVSSVKEDGMETERLYALSNGKYIELDAYDTETLLVPSGTEQRRLKRGDGIRYETNANGEISGIELEYDITKPYTIQNYSSEFNRIWAFSGVVYSKDGNNLVTVKGADKDFTEIDKKYLDPNNRIAMLAGGNVYIYDQETDRVTRGTTDDIFDRKVCGDDASRIYARFNYESCKDIVIYKMK